MTRLLRSFAGWREHCVIVTRSTKRFFGRILSAGTVAGARRFAYAMLLLIPAVLRGPHMARFLPFFLRFILFFGQNCHALSAGPGVPNARLVGFWGANNTATSEN